MLDIIAEIKQAPWKDLVVQAIKNVDLTSAAVFQKDIAILVKKFQKEIKKRET